MAQQSDQEDSTETVEVSVTMKQETLNQLEAADPHSLKTSESLRRAAAMYIDLQSADSYHITRDSGGRE